MTNEEQAELIRATARLLIKFDNERERLTSALQLIAYLNTCTRTTLKQIAFRALDGEDFTAKAIEAIKMADEKRIS